MLTTSSGRNVLLRTPPTGPPAPLIVVIHGYTGTPTGIERFAELTNIATAAGVAVAYPEGTPTLSGGFGWDTGAGLFATEGVGDVRALAEMLSAVTATGCVDTSRIVLSGESNGAGMVLVTACAPELSGTFARLVMVIPAIDEGVLKRCAMPPQSVPLTAVTGDLDRTVPADGSRPPLLAPTDWFPAAAELVTGCSGLSAPSPLDTHVTRTAGTDCAACTELLAIDDGTHTWPGSSRGVGGLTPGSYELNDRLVSAAIGGTAGCLSDS